MQKLIIILFLFFFLIPKLSHAETLSCSQIIDNEIYTFSIKRDGNQFIDEGVIRLDIVEENQTTLILQNVNTNSIFVFLLDKASLNFRSYIISIDEKNSDGDQGSCVVID